MNKLEINPNNEKYYSKEFVQGYKCGTKNQFDADAKLLEQIRNEIANEKGTFPKEHYVRIIDKYKAESKKEENG